MQSSETTYQDVSPFDLTNLIYDPSRPNGNYTRANFVNAYLWNTTIGPMVTEGIIFEVKEKIFSASISQHITIIKQSKMLPYLFFVLQCNDNLKLSE